MIILQTVLLPEAAPPATPATKTKLFCGAFVGSKGYAIEATIFHGSKSTYRQNSIHRIKY
jgi:hypothetical protein